MAIRAAAREIDVQHLLGHSTSAMVRRYTRTYDSEMAAKAHASFSPVAQLARSRDDGPWTSAAIRASDVPSRKEVHSMAITNRTLEAGTRLVGRYKGVTRSLEVIEGEGSLRFRLDDGQEFRSLSAAGSAVMGGVACNGWRFWTPEGSLPEKAAKETKPKANGRAPSAATARNIKRVPNQKGVAEGQTKWFCSACMQSFVGEGVSLPVACPQGHAAEAEDSGDGF